MGKGPKLYYQLRAKDLIPVSGVISYVRRNIEDLGSMEISLRSATLILCNLYLAVGLTLTAMSGLEKLMQ